MDDLKTMAELLLAQWRVEVETTGGLDPSFWIRDADGEMRHLPFPREAAQMMNDGAAKDIIFDALRATIRRGKCTGCIFATEAWMGKGTEKTQGMSKEEFAKFSRGKGVKELEKMGYVVAQEVIVVTAQDEDTVLIIQQPFTRNRRNRTVTFAEPKQMEIEQSQFMGRQKMFGELTPETTR